MILNGIDYDKMPVRYVMCIDVKSFFASVEASRRGIDPLKAYIIVVSNMKRNGSIVLAASPKVKSEFNIKTGNRKFEIPNDPKLMLVEPSMGLYIEMNRKINDILLKYAPPMDIVSYSIDESFIDVTNTYQHFGDPEDIAHMIKNDIREELGLEVTIGIGDNPLLAKLAMDIEAKKTKEQIAYWSYESIPDKVWKIKKLTDFWGISRGYEKRFKSMGISNIYNLAHSDKEIIKKKFGVIGLQHYYHANGVDYSILREKVPQKSKGYSKGQILFSDYTKKSDIVTIIEETVDDVTMRLRKRNKVCRSISLYLGLSDAVFGENIAVSKKLNRLTNNTEEIKKEALSLFEKNWRGEAIRQVDFSCNDISEEVGYQLDFFTLKDENKRTIDRALDKIRDKYGKTSVFRGNALTDYSTFFERARTVGGHKGMTELDE